jgi:hypothetical protein
VHEEERIFARGDCRDRESRDESHYGKRRHGIRRAKKALGFDRARLLMEREKAWSFDRSPQVSI